MKSGAAEEAEAARAATDGGRVAFRPSIRASVLPLLRADNARRKRRFGQIVKMDFGNKRKKRKERGGKKSEVHPASWGIWMTFPTFQMSEGLS